MAEEKEKNPSALEELRQLKRTDRIKSLEIHEPELHDFNAQNIFHIDEEPEKKTIFGKRSAKSHVKINANVFDDEIAKTQEITPNTSIEDVEAPIEKRIVEPKVEEIPKPRQSVNQEQTQHIEKNEVEDEEFTTESVEKELEEMHSESMVEKAIPQEKIVEENVEDENSEEENETDTLDLDDDLYEERKSFLFADYPMIEEYLQDKSSEGYHFVRHEGKKYYFRKGQPRTYYYSMNYFFDEPDVDQWREWENDGWKLVSKSDGKKKSDAGWFTFRNEEEVLAVQPCF